MQNFKKNHGEGETENREREEEGMRKLIYNIYKHNTNNDIKHSLIPETLRLSHFEDSHLIHLFLSPSIFLSISISLSFSLFHIL